jgi:hypothetical protein
MFLGCESDCLLPGWSSSKAGAPLAQQMLAERHGATQTRAQKWCPQNPQRPLNGIRDSGTQCPALGPSHATPMCPVG